MGELGGDASCTCSAEWVGDNLAWEVTCRAERVEPDQPRRQQFGKRRRVVFHAVAVDLRRHHEPGLLGQVEMQLVGHPVCSLYRGRNLVLSRPHIDGDELNRVVRVIVAGGLR